MGFLCPSAMGFPPGPHHGHTHGADSTFSHTCRMGRTRGGMREITRKPAWGSGEAARGAPEGTSSNWGGGSVAKRLGSRVAVAGDAVRFWG